MGKVLSIGSRLFWWGVSVAIGLAVLYAITSFAKRRAGGTVIGGVAQGVEHFTQPR